MKVRFIKSYNGEPQQWLTIGKKYKVLSIDDDGDYWVKDDNGDKAAILKDEIEQTDTILESVINQFRERSEVGIKKYGVTLDRTDLSTLDWIKEAQAEAMDFCLYLEKLHKELVKNQ